MKRRSPKPEPKPARKPARKPRGEAVQAKPGPNKAKYSRPRPPDRDGVTRRWKKSDGALKYAIHLFKEQYSPGQRSMMLCEMYGIDISTAHRWMAEARELLQANKPPTDESVIELREQTRIALDETYRDAKADRDHSARVAAQRERAKIFGLHAPVEFQVAGGLAITGEIVDRRSVDVRAELVKLTELARAAAAPAPPIAPPPVDVEPDKP